MASVLRLRFDEKSLAWNTKDFENNEMLIKALIRHAIIMFESHGYVYASDIFAACICFDKKTDKDAHKYYWDSEMGHVLTIRTLPNSKRHYIDIICEGGTRR